MDNDFLHLLNLPLFRDVNIFVFKETCRMQLLFSGMMFHAIGVILAIIFPVIFATLRLLFSSYAMSWYGSFFFLFSPLFVILSKLFLLN